MKCVFCGEEAGEWGNNPAPLKSEGKCCDRCNNEKVIPERLKRIHSGEGYREIGKRVRELNPDECPECEGRFGQHRGNCAQVN